MAKWLEMMPKTHSRAGMFELYEQLLPTRLYACQKTHTDFLVLWSGLLIYVLMGWVGGVKS